MSTQIVKVKGSFYTYKADKHHKINSKKFPLTYQLLLDNQDKIKEGLKEFYFYIHDFQSYRSELVNADYPYEGINIYGSDQKTVAIQIIRMH